MMEFPVKDEEFTSTLGEYVPPSLRQNMEAFDKKLGTVHEAIASIEARIVKCWQMAEMYLQNEDAHGLHDTGVEVQALQRALAELERLL